MALVGFGLFLSIFGFAARKLPAGRLAWLIYGAVGVLLFLSYKLLACLRGIPTVGERRMRLRVLNFDGRPASRWQRVGRVALGCLSAMPAGVGLLYALINEEHLGFHDLISETYVTASGTSR